MAAVAPLSFLTTHEYPREVFINHFAPGARYMKGSSFVLLPTASEFQFKLVHAAMFTKEGDKLSMPDGHHCVYATVTGRNNDGSFISVPRCRDPVATTWTKDVAYKEIEIVSFLATTGICSSKLTRMEYYSPDHPDAIRLALENVPSEFSMNYLFKWRFDEATVAMLSAYNDGFLKLATSLVINPNISSSMSLTDHILDLCPPPRKDHCWIWIDSQQKLREVPIKYADPAGLPVRFVAGDKYLIRNEPGNGMVVSLNLPEFKSSLKREPVVVEKPVAAKIDGEPVNNQLGRRLEQLTEKLNESCKTYVPPKLTDGERRSSELLPILASLNKRIKYETEWTNLVSYIEMYKAYWKEYETYNSMRAIDLKRYHAKAVQNALMLIANTM